MYDMIFCMFFVCVNMGKWTRQLVPAPNFSSTTAVLLLYMKGIAVNETAVLVS